jgi:hypothetical protein
MSRESDREIQEALDVAVRVGLLEKVGNDSYRVTAKMRAKIAAVEALLGREAAREYYMQLTPEDVERLTREDDDTTPR